MGKRKWRPYNVGIYRLGQLKGEAVAVWTSPNGTRPRFRLDVRSEAEGRVALAAFARNNDVVDARETQRVAAIWDAYILDREKDGKGMSIYRHNWKALSPRFGNLVASDISADLCRSYAQDRFDDGMAPATVNTELARLRQALKWAYDQNIIQRRPPVWVPSPGKPRDRVLSEDEVLAILDGCRDPHVRLFAILLYCTAGRHSAICELTWDRVEFAAGSINLKTPRKIEPMSKRHQKGRAVVHMNDLARAALSEARTGAVTDYVIEHGGGRLKSVKDGFAAAVRRAGLVDVTPHTMRHTAATRMWEKVGPEQVARFLGHSKPDITRSTYAKPGVSYLEEAGKALNLKVVK